MSTSAHLALDRLARHHGVTQRAMLEQLITKHDNFVLSTLRPDAAEWEIYFGIPAVTP